MQDIKCRFHSDMAGEFECASCHRRFCYRCVKQICGEYHCHACQRLKEWSQFGKARPAPPELVAAAVAGIGRQQQEAYMPLGAKGKALCARRPVINLDHLPIIFVVLNVADAYLTQLVLAMGGTELNPLAVPFGSSMLVKGVLAAVVATAILFAGKTGWLRSLNVMLLWVVMWNLWQYAIAQATWLH